MAFKVAWMSMPERRPIKEEACSNLKSAGKRRIRDVEENLSRGDHRHRRARQGIFLPDSWRFLTFHLSARFLQRLVAEGQ